MLFYLLFLSFIPYLCRVHVTIQEKGCSVKFGLRGLLQLMEGTTQRGGEAFKNVRRNRKEEKVSDLAE